MAIGHGWISCAGHGFVERRNRTAKAATV